MSQWVLVSEPGKIGFGVGGGLAGPRATHKRPGDFHKSNLDQNAKDKLVPNPFGASLAPFQMNGAKMVLKGFGIGPHSF